MDLKNTDKKYSIVSKNNRQRRIIAGGLAATSLFLLLASSNISKKQVNSTNEQTEYYENYDGYNYYNSIHLNVLNNMDDSQFDESFIDIYDNGKYIINGNKYDVNEIYISKLEDDSVHLYKAGDNNTDVLSGENLSSKKVKSCCFRDSSIFESLYRSGCFVNKQALINSNISKLLNSWNGEKHLKTPQLMANKEASEAYQRKFGR